MPTYTYQCTKCELVFDELHTIANRETPLSEPCPTCGESGSIDKLLTSPLICDSVRVGVSKIHTGFKEVLQGIHKKYAGSQLDKSTSGNVF